MKRLSHILSVSLLLFCTVSCQNDFLERPNTAGNIDLDKVYSSAVTAEQAVAAAYRNALLQGLPGGMALGHGTLGCISGERLRGWSWHAAYEISNAGLKVSNVLNSKNESCAGSECFSDNWEAIRASYLIKENINRVPDMSDEMKGYIRAEATALIAYRYMGMFYRYGGMPIVRKSFLPADDTNIDRASLEDTLEFILELCEEAYNGLPAEWESKYAGRMTKGAVLAIRARTLQFAARPLFNSASPVLSGGANVDKMICFGEKDNTRWEDAIEAHKDVLEWAEQNGYALRNTGGAGVGEPNPKALDDYGTAVSLPGNKEVILAYKFDATMNSRYDNVIALWNNTSPYLDMAHDRWETRQLGLTTNFLEQYYLTDGSTPSWAKPNAAAATEASVWTENMKDIEPRFKADWIVPFVDNVSNPGDGKWSLSGWEQSPARTFTGIKFPNAGTGDETGAGAATKFYYKAGSRVWCEIPLFRMAETYLSLAEAYNEIGETTLALENLNLVHNRAGLPAVTETGQGALRSIIQREKAIEFVGEGHRYFDVKHWKHPDITNGIIAGPIRELQFLSSKDNGPDRWSPGNLVSFWDLVAYNSFWHPKMYLEPIPQLEVNKGYITQNPGY